MATHIDYDLDLRVIYVTTVPVGGIITLNVEKDIYSAAKLDWKNVAGLDKLKFPFLPRGGFGITPTQDLSPYYGLRPGWWLRPYEASHTLYLTDGLVTTFDGNDPWLPTIGAYTVKIKEVVPSDARTITIITGSGLSQQQNDWLEETLKLGEFMVLRGGGP